MADHRSGSTPEAARSASAEASRETLTGGIRQATGRETRQADTRCGCGRSWFVFVDPGCWNRCGADRREKEN